MVNVTPLRPCEQESADGREISFKIENIDRNSMSHFSFSFMAQTVL